MGNFLGQSFLKKIFSQVKSCHFSSISSILTDEFLTNKVSRNKEMFYFFVDPVCHAKRALRNSGLTDKETSWKHQNIIGNTYAFFLQHVIFICLEQVLSQQVVTILTQENFPALKHWTYDKQDHFIYFLPVPWEKDIFPIKASF